MALVATSLKLPAALKKRVARLAHQDGKSSHAFMVEALARQVEALELHARFVEDGERADAAMEQSGKGHAMEDVHRYFREKARGGPARRPRLVRWRK